MSTPNSLAPTFIFPSHPPVPDSRQQDIGDNDLAQDPKGWTYEAIEESSTDASDVLKPLFPHLGLWQCMAEIQGEGAPSVKETALFLTATSTSTEVDVGHSVFRANDPFHVSTSSNLPLLITHSTSSRVAQHKPHTAPPLLAPSLTAVPPPLPTIAHTHDNLGVDSKSLVSSRVYTSKPSQFQVPQATSAIAHQSTEISDTGATLPPHFTVGTQIISANQQGQFLVAGQTLHPGSILTVSGIPVSLAPNSAYAVVGTATETLVTSQSPPALSAPTPPPALTIGTQVVNPDSHSRYRIDGQTLVPGHAITVSGTMITLAPSETELIVGTSTQALGGIIIGGLGKNGSSVVPYTGTAGSRNGWLWMQGFMVGLAVALVIEL